MSTNDPNSVPSKGPADVVYPEPQQQPFRPAGQQPAANTQPVAQPADGARQAQPNSPLGTHQGDVNTQPPVAPEPAVSPNVRPKTPTSR